MGLYYEFLQTNIYSDNLIYLLNFKNVQKIWTNFNLMPIYGASLHCEHSSLSVLTKIFYRFGGLRRGVSFFKFYLKLITVSGSLELANGL